ncbi:hypothetical protein TIFTF001_037207 [Ficus carica]|uniref:Uncharacterized protein n=1 Tax=Ficus carica TaxID=3494 RepID=A0AA88E5V4_FICCA|nr:hypothetical protein TIFTF001_037184 [Ficus carica]GMN68132.1 hypothetical protein TIFTF001_037193 [Ficus carica]GMN68145.1 hypothetical protein TIFTF001_037198 [Ficus carica]GMN68146.1 hypothetical protein TIFTF001_037207 [Ficus carica]
MEVKFKPNDTWIQNPRNHNNAGHTERKSNGNKRKKTKEGGIVPVKKIAEEDEEFRTWERLRERKLSRKGRWKNVLREYASRPKKFASHSGVDDESSTNFVPRFSLYMCPRISHGREQDDSKIGSSEDPGMTQGRWEND